MIKLSIEEKAKAYDKALERAQALYNDKNEIGYANAESVLEEVFPLLKESEGEKIRKEIFQSIRDNMVVIHKEKYLAWLEKQGEVESDEDDIESEERDIREALNKIWIEKTREKKLVEKVEPKFKVGDWVVSDDKDVHDDYRVCKIVKIDDGRYCIEGGGFLSESSLALYEYRLWTIQDAKDGDVLSYQGEMFILKDLELFHTLTYYCCYDGKRFITNSLYALVTGDFDNIKPATKEQRDLLFQKMHEAGYEWDAEKKELIKIEQKPAWSEEDEEVRQYIVRIMKQRDINVPMVQKALTWLEKQGEKSLTVDIESMIEAYEQRLINQGNGVRNSPIVNMCVAAFKHGVENTLDELHLKQGEPSVKWNKNTEGNKPQVNHSVLMKTTHGVAEGEWKGEYWLQYRWSGSVKDSDVLSWMELSDLEKQAEQKPTLRERYKNIVESEWFKKTHDGMSVSNDEEPKWTDDDEKIRKALIEYFNEQCDMSDWNGVYGYQVVAWLEKQGTPNQTLIWKHWKDGICGNGEGKPIYLIKYGRIYSLSSCLCFECDYIELSELDKLLSEKQGEQEPTDKAEPKFHKGDWVFIEEVKGYKNGPFQIKTVDPFGYNFDECHIIIPFMYEELLSKWTIQNAREGDVLTNGDFPCIFKRCDDNGRLYVYCGINAHNDFSILSEDPENVWDDYSKQYFPATKEQRDTLFAKMKESGYEWLEETKELKKIEQKPTQEIEPFEAEHGKYYYCIKDYFCGGRKQASKGDVVQALRGLPIMGLKDASEYFLPVNFIKCNHAWSEEDEYWHAFVAELLYGIEDSDKEYETKCRKAADWFKSLKQRIGG